MYYIGVDLGTSAVKLLLMDSEGAIKKIVSKEYPLYFPNPGWSEQKPEDWWSAVVEGLKELTADFDKSQVAGISFGGQMHGLVILDVQIVLHARYASEQSRVPVVNAGDGANQHPSQTLLDMYSMMKTQGHLDHLKIAMVGDMKYGRTVHSLIQAMADFEPTFYFVSPDELKMPDEYKQFLDQRGIKYEEHKDMNAVLNEADILYMTRVQKERFADLMEYERVKNIYVLRNEMLANTKPNLKILHPLPRVNEISEDVDTNPKAYYFQQAENGMYTRMAIIAAIMGVK